LSSIAHDSAPDRLEIEMDDAGRAKAVSADNKKMTVHQAIAKALIDNGVEVVFGLLGDANMFTIDSFVHEYGGRFVAAGHETGAALMALGYASLSGKVGVVSVTHGPAVSNTVTPLIEAVKGSLPILLLCGDTKAEDREQNQNIPQRDIIVATGAGFEQVRSARTVVQDLARAMRRAIAERRPVALNIPFDFDWTAIDYQPVPVLTPDNRALVGESVDLDNAIGILAAAKRPVIIAGRGAATAAARETILKLARRIEAPLATTLKAKDLFRGEDYNLGISGTVSTPVAVETIMEADCILSFGASLTFRTTSHGAFLKGKRVIQVNLEPGEIGTNAQPDVGLVGEPGRVADLIHHWLDEADIPPSGWYGEALKSRIENAEPELDPDLDYDNGTVNFRRALLHLDAAVPQDRVVVTDGGRFMRHAWQLARSSGLNSFIAPCNSGSIGLGFSHAIGAWFAAKGRPVFLVSGDGGFVHGGLAEFSTAVRQKVDLIVVICNDGAFGSEIAKFAGKVSDRRMTPELITFDWPEFAPVAQALGGDGVTVRTFEDLALAEEAIRNRTRPLLIDLKVDPYRMQMA
jgi:thiamine pyrophosphate-dependent acetolactate synthase large subunit-like protein